MTDLKLEHGEVFAQWDRPPSHEDHSEDEARHAETLKNGCHIVVRARKIEESKVAVFFGTYRADGGLIKEQVKVREGLTCAKDALDFGKDEAKRYAGGGGGAPADNHHQATPI